MRSRLVRRPDKDQQAPTSEAERAGETARLGRAAWHGEWRVPETSSAAAVRDGSHAVPNLGGAEYQMRDTMPERGPTLPEPYAHYHPLRIQSPARPYPPGRRRSPSWTYLSASSPSSPTTISILHFLSLYSIAHPNAFASTRRVSPRPRPPPPSSAPSLLPPLAQVQRLCSSNAQLWFPRHVGHFLPPFQAKHR